MCKLDKIMIKIDQYADARNKAENYFNQDNYDPSYLKQLEDKANNIKNELAKLVLEE